MPRNAVIHPDDLAHRAALTEQLVTLRRSVGLSVAALARRAGVSPTAATLWERRGPRDRVINTVQAHARALDHRAELVTGGLPDLPLTRVAAAYAAMADDPDTDPVLADACRRSVVIAQLRAARRFEDIDARELARRLGCGDSAVHHVESDRKDPLLSTYQRYARALGGWLVVELRPLPVPGDLEVQHLRGTDDLEQARRAAMTARSTPPSRPGWADLSDAERRTLADPQED